MARTERDVGHDLDRLLADLRALNDGFEAHRVLVEHITADREYRFIDMLRLIRRGRNKSANKHDSPEAKAKRLFLAHLTPEQAAMHKEHGYIETRGARFRWRIYTTEMTPLFSPVVLLSDDGTRMLGSFCGYPRNPMGLPEGDVWLSLKFTVELDEDGWLRIANPYNFEGRIPPKARFLKRLTVLKFGPPSGGMGP